MNDIFDPVRAGNNAEHTEAEHQAGLEKSGARILVIDDDLDTLELISFNLIEANYSVSIAVTGQEGLYKVQGISPTLIVLDLTLPDMDGFEICRKLRANSVTFELPIIILTGRSKEADRVRGFELGANDYLTKPFSPRELLLRIRNLLSSSLPAHNDANGIRMGDLYIDIAGHSVSLAGVPISLTLTEFRLLELLVQQNGRVQSRESLLEKLWEGDITVDPRTVDTHMARLREKLGKASGLVSTVYGVGYRFMRT